MGLNALSALSASDSSPAEERTEVIEDTEEVAESSGSSSGDGQARLAALARAECAEGDGLPGVGGGEERGGGAAGGKESKVRTESRFFAGLGFGSSPATSSGEMEVGYGFSGEVGTSVEKPLVKPAEKSGEKKE